MLARKYRFTVLNSTGQTMTYNNGARLSLSYRLWKLTSTGAIEYSAVQTVAFAELDAAGESVANAGYASTAVQDNSTNLYMGIIGTFIATTDHASTAGPLTLYYEPSAPDAGDVFASNGKGIVLADAIMSFTGGLTQQSNFEV